MDTICVFGCPIGAEHSSPGRSKSARRRSSRSSACRHPEPGRAECRDLLGAGNGIPGRLLRDQADGRGHGPGQSHPHRAALEGWTEADSGRPRPSAGRIRPQAPQRPGAGGHLPRFRSQLHQGRVLSGRDQSLRQGQAIDARPRDDFDGNGPDGRTPRPRIPPAASARFLHRQDLGPRRIQPKPSSASSRPPVRSP